MIERHFTFLFASLPRMLCHSVWMSEQTVREPWSSVWRVQGLLRRKWRGKLRWVTCSYGNVISQSTIFFILYFLALAISILIPLPPFYLATLNNFSDYACTQSTRYFEFHPIQMSWKLYNYICNFTCHNIFIIFDIPGYPILSM